MVEPCWDLQWHQRFWCLLTAVEQRVAVISDHTTAYTGWKGTPIGRGSDSSSLPLTNTKKVFSGLAHAVSLSYQVTCSCSFPGCFSVLYLGKCLAWKKSVITEPLKVGIKRLIWIFWHNFLAVICPVTLIVAALNHPSLMILAIYPWLLNHMFIGITVTLWTFETDILNQHVSGRL